MQNIERDEKMVTAANSFVALNLNETGIVDEFINTLKREITTISGEYRDTFVQGIIQSVSKEKAWHESLCAHESCKVKNYFNECLKMLQELKAEYSVAEKSQRD
jgi:hypothetical protein